jgi:hypothetical protein
VGSEPAQDICQLGSAGAILAGAVSPRGNIIALVDERGTIYLLPLRWSEFGLECSDKLVVLPRCLSIQEKPSCVAIGFRVRGGTHIYLYAVDVKGNLFEKRLESISNPASNQAAVEI